MEAEVPGSSRAGSRFLGEIEEQPAVLERLTGDGLRAIRSAAAAAAGARLVRLVAHGSSDNAASYGVYAFPLLADIPAYRESISLLTYYGRAPELRDSLVVAISQSGRTPDVLTYMGEARGRARLTIALTNDLASPLAQAAEVVVPLCAGTEEAVAASKTYIAAVAALALIAADIGGRLEETLAGVEECAALMAASFPSLAEEVVGPAALLQSTRQMVVIGRGVEFATAREIALKLSETCRLLAEPLTSTALAHGPVAALDLLSPVWAVVSDDECLPSALEAVDRVRRTGAPVIASGSAAHRVPGAGIRLPAPAAPTAVLSPLLSALPGQLFAWALSLARGLDPDTPAGLTKVTSAP